MTTEFSVRVFGLKVVPTKNAKHYSDKGEEKAEDPPVDVADGRIVYMLELMTFFSMCGEKHSEE